MFIKLRFIINDSSIQVPPVLYMNQRLPSGNGHIIDHLNIELLLYIYGKGILRGHCSAECVYSSIIEILKGFKLF